MLKLSLENNTGNDNYTTAFQIGQVRERFFG